MTDAEFLHWLAERLVYVYNESPNIDFVRRLREMGHRMQHDGTSAAEETWTVLSEIARERDHQVEDLGFNVEHDDRLGSRGFGWLLARRSVELCSPIVLDRDDARRLLVEIAAIAVAGIEAVDRV